MPKAKQVFKKYAILHKPTMVICTTPNVGAKMEHSVELFATHFDVVEALLKRTNGKNRVNYSIVSLDIAY